MSLQLVTVAECCSERQTVWMGNRSGIPHRDAELERLSREELDAELGRAKLGLKISGSAKIAKRWNKRIRWIETALAERD